MTPTTRGKNLSREMKKSQTYPKTKILEGQKSTRNRLGTRVQEILRREESRRYPKSNEDTRRSKNLERAGLGLEYDYSGVVEEPDEERHDVKRQKPNKASQERLEQLERQVRVFEKYYGPLPEKVQNIPEETFGKSYGANPDSENETEGESSWWSFHKKPLTPLVPREEEHQLQKPISVTRTADKVRNFTLPHLPARTSTATTITTPSDHQMLLTRITNVLEQLTHRGTVSEPPRGTLPYKYAGRDDENPSWLVRKIEEFLVAHHIQDDVERTLYFIEQLTGDARKWSVTYIDISMPYLEVRDSFLAYFNSPTGWPRARRKRTVWDIAMRWGERRTISAL